MKALVVSTIPPAPLDRGDRLRLHGMLQALSELAETELLLVGTPRPDSGVLRTLDSMKVPAHWFRVPPYQRFLGALKSAIALRPWGLVEVERISKELRTYKPNWDVVVAFQLKSARYAYQVPARQRMLELTDSLGRLREVLPPLKHVLRRASLTGAEREERYWVQRFDRSTVCSAQDMDSVVDGQDRCKVAIVENGIVVWPARVKAGAKDSLLFVGNLYYPPNKEAIRWFLEVAWPRIAAEHADLRLRVVGDGPRRLRNKLVGPRVEWLGHQETLQGEYSRALALVNPTHYGTGTRMKIIHAWAAGLPVISTNAGAAGLAYKDEKNILLANSPREFCDAVSTLRVPDRWAALGKGGFLLAKERHDARRNWSEYLEKVLLS